MADIFADDKRYAMVFKRSNRELTAREEDENDRGEFLYKWKADELNLLRKVEPAICLLGISVCLNLSCTQFGAGRWVEVDSALPPDGTVFGWDRRK